MELGLWACQSLLIRNSFFAKLAFLAVGRKGGRKGGGEMEGQSLFFLPVWAMSYGCSQQTVTRADESPLSKTRVGGWEQRGRKGSAARSWGLRQPSLSFGTAGGHRVTVTSIMHPRPGTKRSVQERYPEPGMAWHGRQQGALEAGRSWGGNAEVIQANPEGSRSDGFASKCWRHRKPYTISDKCQSNLFLKASRDEAPTTSKGNFCSMGALINTVEPLVMNASDHDQIRFQPKNSEFFLLRLISPSAPNFFRLIPFLSVATPQILEDCSPVSPVLLFTRLARPSSHNRSSYALAFSPLIILVGQGEFGGCANPGFLKTPKFGRVRWEGGREEGRKEEKREEERKTEEDKREGRKKEGEGKERRKERKEGKRKEKGRNKGGREEEEKGREKEGRRREGKKEGRKRGREEKRGRKMGGREERRKEKGRKEKREKGKRGRNKEGGKEGRRGKEGRKEGRIEGKRGKEGRKEGKREGDGRKERGKEREGRKAGRLRSLLPALPYWMASLGLNQCLSALKRGLQLPEFPSQQAFKALAKSIDPRGCFLGGI
ncbi:Nst1, partial [Ophiophagus hannah]